MEEAYTALYQEFLRLQSLCLKQAVMLQHLTEALRRQQGLPPGSNGDVEDLVSIPVQCTEENEENLACCLAPARAAPVPALTPKIRGDSDLYQIPGMMDRLRLDQTPAGETLNFRDQAESVDSPRQQRTAESSILTELRQAEQQWHSSQPEKHTRRPWSSSFMNSEMLSQAGGLLMSRVTLQSQVCEFCHAVFPGQTTTTGEFLRHLTTHAVNEPHT